MRKLGWAVCVVGFAAISIRCANLAAQGPEVGPGDGGAALKNPFDPAPPRPAPVRAPAGPTEIEKTFFGKGTPPPSSPYPGAKPVERVDGRPRGLAALMPSAKDDLNKDIAVTPEQGPWMISVMSYVGPQAPEMAREFVFELRQTYKLNAFVFNYGTEERRKEYERVKGLIDQQRKFCEEKGLPLQQKIRIRYTYVPDQCAVLIGGYPNDKAAHREVLRIRNSLPMPDPKKVKLDVKFFALGDQEVSEKTLHLAEFNLKNIKEQAGGYVNPFKRSFAVRNPTIKTEREPAADPLDITVLRKLNAGEPYNLLSCAKPFTLAITQFRTPTAMEGTTEAGGFLSVFNKKKEREDYAAYNANTLAENLRKHMKLDAYVLHTRFASIVTVGGYDSIEDPNLRTMKGLLQRQLRIPVIDMFPEPYPMKVPR